ncbi:MAG: hypothetical protein Solivirus4_9 [Solivirus sp.]|uniref:Uncharacterized protein n=1 Tax=Solivirus sp. TaxID=2487772 RepID=A0A3G5AFZ2_9VIRU|nr:MAG: hypothetical protein Solivirus4_9 [Solivirus sp.]
MSSYQDHEEEDERDDAETDYSHKDQSRLSSLGSNSAEIDSSLEARKEIERQTSAMAEAQLAILQQRNIELKTGIVPIVVPTSFPQTQSYVTFPQGSVASSQMKSEVQQNSSFFNASTTSQAKTPYTPPTTISVNEVIDPRYTIKQYTPKSIILRQTDALPPYFFKAYKNMLTGNDKMKGTFILNCRDGGREGYCYSLYKMKELQDLVLAIFAGIVKPDPGETSTSSTIGNYFSAPLVVSAPTPPPSFTTNNPCIQRIAFDTVCPIVDYNLKLVIGSEKYLIKVLTIGKSIIGGNQYTTEAVCSLLDGKIIQIKLDKESGKWKIPSYEIPHFVE